MAPGRRHRPACRSTSRAKSSSPGRHLLSSAGRLRRHRIGAGAVAAFGAGTKYSRYRDCLRGNHRHACARAREATSSSTAGQRRAPFRLPAGRLLRLSLGHPAAWTWVELATGVVVGRRSGCFDHGPDHCTRRDTRAARQGLRGLRLTPVNHRDTEAQRSSCSRRFSVALCLCGDEQSQHFTVQAFPIFCWALAKS